MGNVLQAGIGQNPARQAAIFGGVPAAVGALTVNKVCGSGLKSVMLAAQAIRAGDADAIHRRRHGEHEPARPTCCPDARAGQRLGDGELVDAMVNDGLWDIYNDFHMGNTAELVADKYKVTREEQDEFAVESHQKAVAAMQRGEFKRRDRAGHGAAAQRRSADRRPPTRDRARTPRVEIAGQAAAGVQKDGGTVTAGNASTINDGARLLLVCSESRAKELGLDVLAFDRCLHHRRHGARMGDDGAGQGACGTCSRRPRRASPTTT